MEVDLILIQVPLVKLPIFLGLSTPPVLLDEYGDYIPAKKESFLLKIIDDASIEGDIKYKTIEVYDKTGKYVVDIHFCVS